MNRILWVLGITYRAVAVMIKMVLVLVALVTLMWGVLLSALFARPKNS